MSEWDIVVVALVLFFFLVVALLFLLTRDQARLAGRMDALRDEVKTASDTCYALRERLKELETGNFTVSQGKCVTANSRGLREDDRNR